MVKSGFNRLKSNFAGSKRGANIGFDLERRSRKLKLGKFVKYRQIFL